MEPRYFLLVFACANFLPLVDFANGIRWLSLRHSHIQWNLSAPNANPGRGIRSGSRSPCGEARRRYGFGKSQAKLCRNTMEAMPHVQQAAITALETCQTVFSHRRWNCSSAERAPHLTPDLTRATREQAYVYAISSAALTYAMARACSSGALYHCTCSAPPSGPPNSNFKWGGCGDNIKWGKQFAKRFLDNAEKSYSRRSSKGKLKRDEGGDGVSRLRSQMVAVNLHNNRVGRLILSESIQTQCKCHGVSGSCSIRTCWKSLPPMLEVGQQLLQSYTKAKEVAPLHTSITDKAIISETHRILRGRDNELTFLTRSPDYCTRDDKLGSFGTTGRKCNVTSNNTDGCRQLCCGRGYRTVVEEKIERCHCKYYYCCYVKCKICRTLTQTHECS